VIVVKGARETITRLIRLKLAVIRRNISVFLSFGASSVEARRVMRGKLALASKNFQGVVELDR